MKNIPIGTDDFRKIRKQGDLYVDKSLFIREVLHSPEVILLPRPRRFGKTLNMTMLHAFFDHSQDSRSIFDGLAITADSEAMKHLNAHPTVFVSFKNITASTWDLCQKRFLEVIRDLMESQKDVIDLTLASSSKRKLFKAAYNLKASISDAISCLQLVTELLHQSTGKKVILLIDEYDTPIHQGKASGYYNEIVSFMRGFLGGALKGNPYLERAVITGILRVAKESIYSGLNNLSVHSVLSPTFSSSFGFTEAEVARLVEEAGSPHAMAEVQAWYNGYRFGQEIIYNPWSILNMLFYGASPLSIYWINTSGNELIAELIQERQALQVGQIESLLRGEAQLQRIEEAVAFNEINESSVWGLLLFSGYLTAETWNPATQMATLRLPNLEVRSFFEGQVLVWLGTPGHVNAMLTDLLNLDLRQFAERLAKSIQIILSYHDIGPNTPEKIYHVLMVGLLASLNDRFEVYSNRESGLGRYDLALIPRQLQLPGLIFEFKQAEPKHLEAAAQAALSQIGERDYAQVLQERGLAKIAWIGLAFSGKDVALASSIHVRDQPSELVQFTTRKLLPSVDPEIPAQLPDQPASIEPGKGKRAQRLQLLQQKRNIPVAPLGLLLALDSQELEDMIEALSAE